MATSVRASFRSRSSIAAFAMLPVFHLLMALLVALLLVFCIVLVPRSCVQVPVADVIQTIVTALMMALVVWYCHACGHRKLREFCLYFLWIICICSELVVLIALAGTAPTPLIDSKLAGLDALTGVQVPMVVGSVASIPWIARTLAFAYNLSGPFALGAILAPAFARRAKEFKRALLAGSISGILTIALFSLFPAIGPWVFYGFHPTEAQSLCEKSLRLLKSGQPVSVHSTFAIVSFPSFHVALAILCALILWNFRLLRIPSIILALAICLSTVTTGWHYLTDVAGGIVIGVLAFLLSDAVVRFEVRVAATNAHQEV